MALTDSIIVVGTRDSGSLLAIDRRTGAVRWETKLDNSNFFFGRVLRQGNGLVYAAPYALSAVDPASGLVRWTYRVLVPGFEDVARYPAVQGGALYVASQYGYVSRLNALTGAVEWQVDLREAVFPATVADTLVLVGTRSFADTVNRDGPFGAGRVVALSQTDGRIVWQAPVPDSAGFPGSGGVVTEPLVMSGVVIVGTMSSHVVGLRLADGVKLWDHSDGSPVDAAYQSSPVAFGDVAAILRNDGRLEAFDPGTGRRLWSLGGTLDYTVSIPQVARGRLYVVKQANVWIVGAGGQVLWRYGAAMDSRDGLPFFSLGPTIGDDGTIYATWTDQDGNPFVGAILPPPGLR
jgi:outer membrane protein assembly factor BamB